MPDTISQRHRDAEVTHAEEMLAFAIIVHLNAPRAQEQYIAQQIANLRAASEARFLARMVEEDMVEVVARIIDPAAWSEDDRFKLLAAGQGNLPEDPAARDMCIRSGQRRIGALTGKSIDKVTAAITAIAAKLKEQG